MRILNITAQKPHSTGSGTYMTELVSAFDRMGCRQAAVFGIYPDDEVSFPEGVICRPVYFTKSVPVDRSAAHFSGAQSCQKALPFPIAGMSDEMPYESTRYRDMTPEMIKQFGEAFISAVSSAVDELDPDLIICHHLFLITALVRKHFPERKIAGISHGSDLRQIANCSDLADIVRPEAAKLDAVFALHAEHALRIKSIFGIDDDKVKVIGSGYNGRLFNTAGRTGLSADNPVRLCFAGKISRAKGVPEMLKALSKLAADSGTPPFTLTMAGGCHDHTLKGTLDRLPSYIEYAGQIPQPALAELLRRTDIFILPSYYEGLPLVLIEAMASGAVPVSTDLPGVREWINANVKDPNVLYVTMPPMQSIDEPTDEGRTAFTDELAEVIGSAIKDIKKGRASALPDTSSITWDGVAERLLECCR